MDGLSMIWRHAITDYFFESKWMMDMLKGAYHPNELRVIAHDNVVQLIGKGRGREQWGAFCIQGECNGDSAGCCLHQHCAHEGVFEES
jgi:hypothetical protein